MFPNLAAYEKELKGEGIMLDSDNVRLYAPNTFARGANNVFPYLVKAYEELHRVVGVLTPDRINLLAFPEGSEVAGPELKFTHEFC